MSVVGQYRESGSLVCRALERSARAGYRELHQGSWWATHRHPQGVLRECSSADTMQGQPPSLLSSFCQEEYANRSRRH